MAETPLNPDEYARIIVLINGTLDDGGPFWCYVAVKPNMYDAFQAAQKEGKLNLYKFTDYGEIVVSGKGTTPPNDVTAKVQVMYHADPGKDFNKANPAQSVKEAMKELEKKLKENEEK